MTEFERKILNEIQNLRAEVAALRENSSIARITYFENLPIDSIVGTDFVAYKFNISEEAARRGRYGTDAIPRIREKPLAFRKRDVLAVFQNLNKSSSERAAEIRFRAKNKTRGRKWIWKMEMSIALTMLEYFS